MKSSFKLVCGVVFGGVLLTGFQNCSNPVGFGSDNSTRRMQSLVAVDNSGNVDQNGDPTGQPPAPSPDPSPSPSPSPGPGPSPSPSPGPSPSPSPGPTPAPAPSPNPDPVPPVDNPPNSQPPVCKHIRHDDDDSDSKSDDSSSDDSSSDDSSSDSKSKVSRNSGNLLMQSSLKSQLKNQCNQSGGGNGGKKNDNDDDDPRCYQEDEAVGCILLEGHGKSLKLALLTTGGLGGSTSRVDSVCVPKATCLNAVAQAFKTRTQVAPGSHGYCKHNNNVKTLKASQVRALLPVK